ncbi:MAG: glycoside hydrolase, partial [Holophagales bacterium]|nr:glycoside hydrolase [Holophagales bacterium]
DSEGNFYYNSLRSSFDCDVYKSGDAGFSWAAPVYAFGGDKQWMSVDRTSSIGRGHLYTAWYPFIGCCSPDMFNRSTDGGATFGMPIEIGDGLRRGTTAVGADGAVYVTGHSPTDSSVFAVAKSTTAKVAAMPMTIDSVVPVDLGGSIARGVGPNPAGLLGQVWVVADPGDADRLYVLASVNPPGDDPLDVHLVRSTDGGATWSAPVRVNDDATTNDAWQWFGTLSVAPDGRLDAVWNDTRADPGGLRSVTTYAASFDGGLSWTPNEPLGPDWDPLLGFPNQDKIGDYYESISFDDAVHLAYAATFNGEQDVYYLRIPPPEPEPPLFADGFESGNTSAWSATVL